MLEKIKNSLKGFSSNFDYYMPGVGLILFGFFVLVVPYVLVFFAALLFISLGMFYIRSVRMAACQESQIKRFNEFFKERTRSWYSKE